MSTKSLFLVVVVLFSFVTALPHHAAKYSHHKKTGKSHSFEGAVCGKDSCDVVEPAGTIPAKYQAEATQLSDTVPIRALKDLLDGKGIQISYLSPVKHNRGLVPVGHITRKEMAATNFGHYSKQFIDNRDTMTIILRKGSKLGLALFSPERCYLHVLETDEFSSEGRVGGILILWMLQALKDRCNYFVLEDASGIPLLYQKFGFYAIKGDTNDHLAFPMSILPDVYDSYLFPYKAEGTRIPEADWPAQIKGAVAGQTVKAKVNEG